MADDDREAVVVPHGDLAPELLREGTDYGEREISLEDKVVRVITQLKRGEAQIVFDPDTDTVSIVRADPRPGALR